MGRILEELGPCSLVLRGYPFLLSCPLVSSTVLFSPALSSPLLPLLPIYAHDSYIYMHIYINIYNHY